VYHESLSLTKATDRDSRLAWRRSTRQVFSVQLALASDCGRLLNVGVNVIIETVQGDPKTTGEHIMEKQPNSRMCFVCGVDNPIGLHLAFYTDDEGRCIARFQPKPQHQGYPGQLHGGIISSLLDEPTQIPLHVIALLV
jgi:hypothetical protein